MQVSGHQNKNFDGFIFANAMYKRNSAKFIIENEELLKILRNFIKIKSFGKKISPLFSNKIKSKEKITLVENDKSFQVI